MDMAVILSSSVQPVSGKPCKHLSFTFKKKKLKKGEKPLFEFWHWKWVETAKLLDGGGVKDRTEYDTLFRQCR